MHTPPQKGAKGSVPHLARASACLALSHLIPALITANTDLIYQTLDSLMLGLPASSSSAQEVPLVQMHHGIGLGLVLARLFEEHFVDVAGTQVFELKCHYKLDT